MKTSRRKSQRIDTVKPFCDLAKRRQINRPSLLAQRARLKKDAPDYYRKLFGDDEDLKGE